MKKFSICILILFSCLVMLISLSSCNKDEPYSEDDLNKLVNELQATIEQKEATNETAVNNLLLDYSARIAIVEKAESDSKERLTEIEAEYLAKVEELNSNGGDNAEALALLKEQYDADKAKLTDAIAKDSADITDLKNELQAKIDSTNAAYSADIELINALLSELETITTLNDLRIKELEALALQQKADADAQKVKLEEEMIKLKQELEGLETELEELTQIKTNNVVFKPENGTDEYTVTVVHGLKLSSQEEPTKAGYSFDGWYCGDEKWIFAGYTVTEPITLTAKWTPVEYDIDYVLNGGEAETGFFSIYNIETDVALPVPTRDGYSFIGWYDNPDFEGQPISKISAGETGNKVFYARWDIVEYTIDYELDGGTTSESLPTSYTILTETFSLPVPLKYGYKFCGWVINDNTDASLNLTIKKGTVGNLTLKAVYDLEVYSITYHLNGLSNSSKNPSSYTYNSPEIILQNAANVESLGFVGWFADPEFTVPFKSIPSGSTGDYHVYAKAQPIGWWGDITYDQTSLLFQMTDCTNELSSGCARYLAGEKPETADIDKYVAERNNDVLYNTRISSITYVYYPDNSNSYGYSRTIDLMSEAAKNPDSNTPDMFCNWMSDVLCSALKGSFANLYSTTQGEGDQYGKNYFDLSQSGYMADLMGSLTLSQSKIYVVASDYFIDLIRSFYVVPVNVELYNSIARDMIDDLNEDGAYDINDFYAEVKNGDWTYDRLIQYAAKIYDEANKTLDGSDTEEVLGFALARNALVSSGLVYSSSVSIINKTPNANGGFTYAYPAENQELYNLSSAIANLVNQTGIMCVTDKGDDTSVINRVRTMFSSNKLLFGGITLLGSLEETAYQEMMKSESGGFGVVPVPVYRAGDDYLTQIHVDGRAGAIAQSTTKFVQCTAYLHYQSSNSAKIVNEYYDYNFTLDGADSLDGNVDMLKFIRENVRTSFDRLFEDAIGYFYESGDPNALRNRWHNIIVDNEFNVEYMRDYYTSIVPNKVNHLKNIVAKYENISD